MTDIGRTNRASRGRAGLLSATCNGAKMALKGRLLAATIRADGGETISGEKSSLSVVLRPIAEHIGAEMILVTGESSDSHITGMAKRASEDGRPAVVFYFSDFDPSGHQNANQRRGSCRPCATSTIPTSTSS